MKPTSAEEGLVQREAFEIQHGPLGLTPSGSQGGGKPKFTEEEPSASLNRQLELFQLSSRQRGGSEPDHQFGDHARIGQGGVAQGPQLLQHRNVHAAALRIQHPASVGAA